MLNESSRVPTHDTPGAFEGQSNFHDQSFVSRMLFSAGRKSDSLKVSGTSCFLFRRYQIDFVFLSNLYLYILKSQMLLVHFWMHNIIPILLKHTYIHINYLSSLIKLDYACINLRDKPTFVFSVIVLRCNYCKNELFLMRLEVFDSLGNRHSHLDVYFCCIRYNGVMIK